ncbi:hypothetical protein LAM21_25035, partial [Mycobacterium tuberculosis]|nr:hypothetical protein [Mycobacterium tuberculosis]
SVPMDIFSKEIDTSYFEKQKLNAKNLYKPSIDEETATKIIHTLAEAKSPVFYVGGGIMLADAADELRELVDSLNMPVA